MSLVYGSDPEVFASEVVNGVEYVVPPVLFRTDLGYKADKVNSRHPIFKRVRAKGGSIVLHEDGAAFELSVPPANSLREVFGSIQTGYECLDEFLHGYGYSVRVLPTINFDTNKYSDKDIRFKMCLVFGCDPDDDVFEIENIISARPMEEAALLHPYRYGGGHIHISGSPLIKEKPLLAIKALAFTVGQYVIGHSPFPELDHLRVYRYGRPGRFRIQNYNKTWKGVPDTDIGIEYRTPSNSWTTSEDIAENIQNLIEIAINRLLPDNSKMRKLINTVQADAVRSVMNGDAPLARMVLDYVVSEAH